MLLTNGFANVPHTIKKIPFMPGLDVMEYFILVVLN